MRQRKTRRLLTSLADGKFEPFQPVTHEAYLPVVELNKFVDNLRKKQ
jgi:phosphonate transport system substrate-binding protein